jgi:hypothetical protein
MKSWIKKILGITSLESEIQRLNNEMDNRKKEAIQNSRDNSVNLGFIKEDRQNITELLNKVNARYVTRKLEGYTSEHEYIELSTKIYILDNGWRKQNKPYVKSDSNGVVDEYVDDIGPDAKMRCYMIRKLVLPGYGNDEKFDPYNENFKDEFEYVFGKSYRELVSYMREFNYHRVDNEMYSLNFYEI